MAERNANSVKGETIERTRSVSERSLRNLIPYKKGQTGNPDGKTKQFAQCERLCREASPDAARRLIELIQSEDERVALMAANKIFERLGSTKRVPDYALSSAIKVWYKTGTCGCFCGFERWRATRCNFKRGSARPSLPFFMEQRISAGRRGWAAAGHPALSAGFVQGSITASSSPWA